MIHPSARVLKSPHGLAASITLRCFGLPLQYHGGQEVLLKNHKIRSQRSAQLWSMVIGIAAFLLLIMITLLEAAENLPEYSLSFLEILPEIIIICIRNFMPELGDRMC